MSGDSATASRLDAADLKALLDGGACLDERELRAVIETSGELIAVTGSDGHFLLLNKQWERSLGWSRVELRAQPFIDFVHPEDRKKTELIAGRMIEQSVVLAFANRYRCKDGSYRSLLWRGFFDRQTGRFYTATVDQHAILTARAESEALSALCELTPALVLIEDAQGNISRWDGAAEARWGWTPSDLVGRPLTNLLRAPDGTTPTSLSTLLDTCDDEDDISARLLLPSGETVAVRLAAREFGDGLAPVVGIVAVVRPAREDR